MKPLLPLLALALLFAPATHAVDVSTLTGKVMCGYQGWFTTENDGGRLPWQHWTTDGRVPTAENIRVDMWPDVSELGPMERFATGLRHADGRVAEVFSSLNIETVRRHFRWMREHGIDGAFVQRFAPGLKDPRVLEMRNTALARCRDAAAREGRAFALMYDLSGLGAGRIGEVRDDFRRLCEATKLTDDPAYLRHRGKPLVAVWGVGFSDGRKYTLAECRELVGALKTAGCSVMLGVPTHWLELKADAAPDPALHDLLRMADVVSPWTVGRFGDDRGIARHAEKFLAPDLAWCAAAKLDYLPVVFPGFSWRNMNRRPGVKFDQIPRRGGEFFWNQITSVKRSGATMLYVAMFDEVDEATAIFKTTSDTPDAGDVRFISEKGVPADRYLILTGAAGKLLRGELPADTPFERAAKP
jgi:hypothetical protein